MRRLGGRRGLHDGEVGGALVDAVQGGGGWSTDNTSLRYVLRALRYLLRPFESD